VLWRASRTPGNRAPARTVWISVVTWRPIAVEGPACAGSSGTTRISRRSRREYRPVGARVVGDLRYDRLPGLDFSDLPLDRAAPCPKRVPPWIPRRSDLFGPLE
jgi:hypothetical protein